MLIDGKALAEPYAPTPCGPLTSKGELQLPRELLEFLQWERKDNFLAKVVINNQGGTLGLYIGLTDQMCAHCGCTEIWELLTFRVKHESGKYRKTSTCRACLEAAKSSKGEGL